MTTENRGGARAPDGIPRPNPIAFANGPNRTDLSALPGTPGTPLEGGIGPGVPSGQGGQIRDTLKNLPLDRLQPGVGGLMDPTQRPNEPVTQGASLGPGAGPEANLTSPMNMGNGLASSQIRYAYPLIMRLASLPDATQQTKILAQRIRANLPVQPQQMPRFPGE